MHFLHPRGARVGHVDVDVGERADRAAVAAGQRDRASGRARARRAGPRPRWRIGRWSRCRTPRRRGCRALRSAARTPGRTRSRWRSPSACSVSVVSAIAATGRRSRWNRPTSSAAMCCASAALPPLPNTSTLPPVPRRREDRRRDVGDRLEVLVAQPFVHARCDAATTALDRRDRLATASASVALPVFARRLEVRDELLLRHLQRLVGLHRHA